MPTGKQNPFHAEVYFINKAVRMNINWGTSERVHFIEPTTGIPIDVGAHGSMNMQVVDGRKLLIKLVGTTNGFTIFGKNNQDQHKSSAALQNENSSLIASFKPLIQTTVKSNLASILKNNNIDIFEYDEKVEDISKELHKKLLPGFEEYGITIPQFYLTGISYDENDKNIQSLISMRAETLRMREIDYQERLSKHSIESKANIEASRRLLEIEEQETKLQAERFEAERLRIAATAEADARKIKGAADVEIKRESGLADAEIMRAKGYTERDVLATEVQKAYAEGIGNIGSNGGGGNGGGGSMVSDILGLGVGMAAMGTVGEKVNNVMQSFNGANSNSDYVAESGWSCSACGAKDNKGKFCSECGKAKPELWDCNACGAKGNKGKFCSECGKAKPELWDCPHCGAKGNKGKFCSECGKTNEPADTWDCSCGNKNITGKFCSECGNKKGEAEVNE